MRLVLHPAVERELDEARDWYERRRIGLGDELEDEVTRALRRIVPSPHACRPWPGHPRIRMRPVARFPYQIPYAIETERLRVLAIAHARRRPGYWLARW